MNCKRISIYNFTDHPSNGIGGRRWTLFAQHLKQEGHTVTITCSTGANKKYDDGIKRRFVYPTDQSRLKTKFWRLLPASIAHKIRWKLGVDYEDQSTNYKTDIIRMIQRDVLQMVDIVIVSCPPFHWSYDIALFMSKHRNSQTKLVLDLRDPWSDNKVSHIYHRSPQAKIRERAKEEFVKSTADAIIVVNEMMKKTILDPKLSDKTFVIHNASEFEHDGSEMNYKLNTKVLKIAYTGLIYNSECAAAIKETLSLIRETTEYQNVIFTYAGSSTLETMKLIVPQGMKLNYLGLVSPSTAKCTLKKSNIALVFVPTRSPWIIPTKLIENAAWRIPSILLTINGQAERIFKNAKLGLFINTTEIMAHKTTYSNWEKSCFSIGPTLNMQDYELKFTTNQLSKLIRILSEDS